MHDSCVAILTAALTKLQQKDEPACSSRRVSRYRQYGSLLDGYGLTYVSLHQTGLFGVSTGDVSLASVLTVLQWRWLSHIYL